MSPAKLGLRRLSEGERKAWRMGLLHGLIEAERTIGLYHLRAAVGENPAAPDYWPALKPKPKRKGKS